MSDVGRVLIDIDLLIAKCEKIGSIKVQPVVAEALKEHLSETIAAGTDPYGSAWQKTQKGATPLQNAASHLQFYSTPKTAGVTTTRDVEARHHLGRVRGGANIRLRTIIPTKLIPIKLAHLIKIRLHEAFVKAAA